LKGLRVKEIRRNEVGIGRPLLPEAAKRKQVISEWGDTRQETGFLAWVCQEWGVVVVAGGEGGWKTGVKFIKTYWLGAGGGGEREEKDRNQRVSPASRGGGRKRVRKEAEKKGLCGCAFLG